MSLRAQSLFERIHDLTEPSGCSGAGDLATREALGREVMRALVEIDRATAAADRASGVTGDPTTMQVAVALGTQSPVFLGAVWAATDSRGAAALDAGTMIGASASVRVTGRQLRHA